MDDFFNNYLNSTNEEKNEGLSNMYNKLAEAENKLTEGKKKLTEGKKMVDKFGNLLWTLTTSIFVVGKLFLLVNKI